MKTSELIGDDLDQAVARTQGYPAVRHSPWIAYSTDWAFAGPIIERENIATWPDDEEGGWFASLDGGRSEDYKGSTPLIAAMRCFVASRKGVAE